jgi:hypothetical protein
MKTHPIDELKEQIWSLTNLWLQTYQDGRGYLTDKSGCNRDITFKEDTEIKVLQKILEYI